MLGRVSEHIRELVEVRREEAKGVDFRRDVSAHTRDQPEKGMTHEDDVLGDGPSQPEPIVRRRSTSEFVDDDERIFGRALILVRCVEYCRRTTTYS